MQTEPCILIVDDNPTNIDVLVSTLQNDYRLGVAKKANAAVQFATTYRPDLIMLDIKMPEMDGYDVAERLKSNPATADIPLVFISARCGTKDKTRAFSMGAVDFITKPFNAAEVKARVKAHISLEATKSHLLEHNTELESIIAQQTVELKEILDAAIHSMALMAEIRDPYTAGHQQRVAKLASAIARCMGLTEKMAHGIHIAGILHDVGKIRVPVSILNRTGRLLKAEMEVIKIHPQIGFEVLKNIPFPWPIAQMVFQHHERLDGSGYPLGITGKEMLLESRILAVADVSEATGSFRPYRPAQGTEAAITELQNFRGIYYDKDAVDACVTVLQSGEINLESIGHETAPFLCVASPETIHSSFPSLRNE